MGNEKTKESRGGRGRWLLVFFLAILVIVASCITLRRNLNLFHRTRHPDIVGHKYADALGIALQFFDVQKCKQTRLVRCLLIVLA